MKKLIRKIFNRFGYEIIRSDGSHALRGNRKEKKIQVGQYEISMPGNNPLLNVYKTHAGFNTHFSKLAQAVFQKYPQMTVVDVGANVGDTIALLRSAINVPVIGIEGDEISFGYLEKNTKQFSGVQIVKTFLGEKAKEIRASLEKTGWNTTIIPTERSGKTIAIKTLDEVLGESTFSRAEIRMVKIDAEGFDTIIIRGAYQLIARSHPVIFFEYNPENMNQIGENGLGTLFSFRQYGYHKIIFFDCLSAVLLVTVIENENDINCLHHYVNRKSNLLRYYDIAVFHENDSDIAEQFLRNYASSLPG